MRGGRRREKETGRESAAGERLVVIDRWNYCVESGGGSHLPPRSTSATTPLLDSLSYMMLNQHVAPSMSLTTTLPWIWERRGRGTSVWWFVSRTGGRVVNAWRNSCACWLAGPALPGFFAFLDVAGSCCRAPRRSCRPPTRSQGGRSAGRRNTSPPLRGDPLLARCSARGSWAATIGSHPMRCGVGRRAQR